MRKSEEKEAIQSFGKEIHVKFRWLRVDVSLARELAEAMRQNEGIESV